ncbi:MAG: S-layer homology domain-containing protein [Thermoanaerobaculia bacterium]
MLKLAGAVCVVSLTMGLSSPVPAQAQEPLTLQKLKAPATDAVTPPLDFGTADYEYTVIPASDFRPLNSATGHATDLSNGNLYRTGGGGPSFFHWIDIPRGAVLADITYYVHDVDATNNIGLYFGVSYRTTGTNGSPGWGNYLQSVTSGTPGDTALVQTWNNTMLASFVIFNVIRDVSWFVVVDLGPDFNTSFNSVRLRWKRQVSPAPATARFTDVPTSHPFFQYIEALAASGVTGGCVASPPQYCPDAPVTRGQMAVFLSRALGLHWTP